MTGSGQTQEKNSQKGHPVSEQVMAEVLAVLRTVPGRKLLRRASVSSLVGAAEPHMCAELPMLRAASGHASVLTRCSYDNSCAKPRDAIESAEERADDADAEER